MECVNIFLPCEFEFKPSENHPRFSDNNYSEVLSDRDSAKVHLVYELTC